MQADPSGRFAITNVVPGGIELFVEAPGFAVRHLEGLVLEVGRVLDLDITRHISALDLMVRYSVQRQDDIAASTLERPIDTASYRQASRNRIHSVLGAWTRVLSPRAVNALSVSYSGFDNAIAPVEPGVQLTFPSLSAGSSFRVPQGTRQRRWQIADSLSWVRGTQTWKFGGQVQRVDAPFDLGVFREGRIERQVNADGGIDGEPLPLVSDGARFTEAFNSLDLRLSRPFVARRLRIEPIVEVFNLFNVSNVLGTSNTNYSGYVNALVRDSTDPGDAGYLGSSRFGTPVSTAGGVFGSGGPRALQFGARVTF